MDLRALFASNAFTRRQVELLRALAAQILAEPAAAVTVAELGTPTAGLRAIVTDADSPVFAATVIGGGASTVPVYADGTEWRVG